MSDKYLKFVRTMELGISLLMVAWIIKTLYPNAGLYVRYHLMLWRWSFVKLTKPKHLQEAYKVRGF